MTLDCLKPRRWKIVTDTPPILIFRYVGHWSFDGIIDQFAATKRSLSHTKRCVLSFIFSFLFLTGCFVLGLRWDWPQVLISLQFDCTFIWQRQVQMVLYACISLYSYFVIVHLHHKFNNVVRIFHSKNYV